MMKGNVCCRFDRLVRVVLGLGLLGLPIHFYFSDMPWLWGGLVGLVLLVSGMIGFCPVYAMFGCGYGKCSKGDCSSGDKEGKMGGCCGRMKDEKKG